MAFWHAVPGVRPGVLTGDAAWNLLMHAKTNGNALLAINCWSSDTITAALQVGRMFHMPIVIQFSNSDAALIAGKGLRNVKSDKYHASVLGAIAGAKFVWSVAPAYGIPVLLHTDHCHKKLLPWLDGLLEADEAHFKQTGEPLFSSHMLDLSEEPDIENLKICKMYLERMVSVKLILEVGLGIVGSEDDMVDHSGVKPKLYSTVDEIFQAYETLTRISSMVIIAPTLGNWIPVQTRNGFQATWVVKTELLAEFQHFAELQTGLEQPLTFAVQAGAGFHSESASLMEIACMNGAVKINWAFHCNYEFWKDALRVYSSLRDGSQARSNEEEGETLKPDPCVWMRECIVECAKQACLRYSARSH
eukprot:TRINITY_DN41763_c0_g1_i1.p1 TRINITY_DN41763_c0_g1~~TRINITY_DN41763_c0_g1_i1.p1  ORF type:complete len:361 (-),score=59.42 TRINITY_DN41763_c0_g1_i1:83-1165(-)